MAKEGLEDNIETYMKQQPDWFETLVLGCAIQDPEFFQRVQNTLCKDLTASQDTDDFSELLRNPVYRTVADYNSAQLLGAPKEFVPIRADTLAVMLRNRAGDADDILDDEIPKAVALFNQAAAVDMGQWKSTVMIGISKWIAHQKTMQVIQSPYIHGGWTLPDIRDRLSLVEQQAAGLGVNANAKRGVIGEALAKPLPPDSKGDLLESNLTALNDIMGGGFRKKDTTMIISPSGGGKTILACQLAGHWALTGKGGILVTTEQDQYELEERFVSNFAKIPFKDVVGKFDVKTLTEKHKYNYELWLNNMTAPIQVVDWTVPGNSVVGNLRNEILQYEKTFRQLPEYIVFDWVGGALQDAAGGDPAVLRSLYKTAVDSVCDLAREFKIVGIVLAQATAGSSVNKANLNFTHIADAKNMIEKVSTLIGLSAIFAEGMDEETDTAKALYSDKQWLCVSKSRKGQGGTLPVKRNYAHQRLENW